MSLPKSYMYLKTDLSSTELHANKLFYWGLQCACRHFNWLLHGFPLFSLFCTLNFSSSKTSFYLSIVQTQFLNSCVNKHYINIYLQKSRETPIMLLSTISCHLSSARKKEEDVQLKISCLPDEITKKKKETIQHKTVQNKLHISKVNICARYKSLLLLLLYNDSLKKKGENRL